MVYLTIKGCIEFHNNDLLVDMSVSKIIFRDFYIRPKPHTAQHVAFIFRAKGPLDTKLSSFISRKRAAAQTLNLACRLILLYSARPQKINTI